MEGREDDTGEEGRESTRQGGGTGASGERADRLAAALRENLRRRKSQARARRGAKALSGLSDRGKA